MSNTDTSMDPNHHATGLASHCRICGQKFSRRSETINKVRDKQMQDLIQLTYNIDVHKDDEHIHPPLICLRCYSRMQHMKAGMNKRHIQTNVHMGTTQ